MPQPLVNRTLTPPDKGGSQWDEQDAIERTLEWVRATFRPEQVFDLYDHDLGVAISFIKWIEKNGYIKHANSYYNNEPPIAGKQVYFTLTELFNLFIQQQTTSNQ